MKHLCCLLIAALIILFPVLAMATAVPANPMAPPGVGVIATAVPAPPKTQVPTAAPTEAPTQIPTMIPTAAPTEAPTQIPTMIPTAAPTEAPTQIPTMAPTAEPTEAPTQIPTAAPTDEPVISVPAIPDSDFISDELLSEEIIAQLDAEVRDYLIGDGELIDTIDGIRNILLVGVDARPGETRSRSDTMLILTLDGNANEIRMTSLMRDMYVSIPGHGNNRINAAWVFGGPELLLDTIEENFGLVIDEYVAVDLRALIDIVDDLGGLTLTVESKKQLNAINGVIDAFNYQFKEPENDGLLTELGEQLMNGKQVQAYARYRKIDSDAHRTARQREVLSKLFAKLQTKSVFELTRIAYSAMEHVDTNLSLSEIVSLIPVAFGMKDAEIRQLNIPYDASFQSKTISGMAVYVPDLSSCRKALDAFVNGETN
ncbi:MAG: LCP family protein [Clostridia bacterium]|nr:LCP family protein [Clostridia bacterium]